MKQVHITRVVLLVSASIAQQALGMSMEQHEYTVASNVAGVKVAFGGQSLTTQKSKKTQIAAPYSATVDFTFPENKENTYSISREILPGDLNLRIVRVGQGQYTIFLMSRKTGGEQIRHIDVQ